jgi:phosphate uptake regulator
METRRLIKFGKNSYVVSLPKAWVEANRLRKGADIYLEEKPESVILFASQTRQPERVVRLSCEGKRLQDLQTEITSYYKAGHTTLIVEGRNLPEHIEAVRAFVHNLAGAEIVEQSRTRLVVKDLIDINQVALPTLVNRMDMMVRSMFQDALSGENAEPAVLRDRDKDLNRLQFLVARIVRNILENPAVGHQLNVTSVEAYTTDGIAKVLERIGDYLKRADGDLLRGSPAARARLRSYLKEAYETYLLSMKCYYDGSGEKAVRLHTDIVQLLSEFTLRVHAAKEKDEVLALENIKNIFRDLRHILRSTVESCEPEAKPAKAGR